MSDIYINIEDVMRRMAGLGYEDHGRLICDALGNSSIENLQDLVRCGLPHAFNTGMVALYYDANGMFIGPSNPALIDQDPLSRSADEIGDDLP